MHSYDCRQILQAQGKNQPPASGLLGRGVWVPHTPVCFFTHLLKILRFAVVCLQIFLLELIDQKSRSHRSTLITKFHGFCVTTQSCHMYGNVTSVDVSTFIIMGCIVFSDIKLYIKVQNHTDQNLGQFGQSRSSQIHQIWLSPSLITLQLVPYLAINNYSICLNYWDSCRNFGKVWKRYIG